MTAARANTLRVERIKGAKSNRERRKAEEAEKQAEAGRMTFERLWSLYLQNKPDLKGVAQDESRYRRYIQPDFGEKEPVALIPLDVDRLKLRMKKNGLSPQMVKLTLALMRRLCLFGVRKRLCDPLPFQIEIPKVDNETTEDLTAVELKRLMEAIEADHDVQAGNLMRLALFTGMRRGELFKLKWNDVDFEREFITIRNPKGGISQTIPMNAEARKALEGHPRTGSEYVFPGRNGKQRTEIRGPVKRIRKRAGLPANFRPLHGLRHVYASMLASSGQVDMYTLQKLLTHKSPVMTQRYAHLRDEALRRASDVAGSLFGEYTNGEQEKVAKIEKAK